jgi:hypothetical protein
LAVDAHRSRLHCERGANVSFEEALADWNQFHAVRWREERQRALLAEQRAEIERHKWIESEKAGRDLGRDAVLDWITKNAAAWRNWYEIREEAVR